MSEFEHPVAATAVAINKKATVAFTSTPDIGMMSMMGIGRRGGVRTPENAASMRYVEAGIGAILCALVPYFVAAEPQNVPNPGQISATVHFEPRPVAKAKTTTIVVLSFGWRHAGGDRVNAANCLCTLAVFKAVSTAHVPAARYRMHAFGRDRDELAANVTFPSAGTYVLALTGSPKHIGAFTPFEQTFRTNVSH